MKENEEDYIILKSGYNQAINDILTIIDDESLKEKILKKQKDFLIGNKEYEATIYKYYIKECNMGYVIFEDIYEIKGVLLDLNKNEIIEIPEDEIIKIRQELLPDTEIEAKNKEYAKLTYENILAPFK